MDFAIAVKSFIVNNKGELLLIKRGDKAPHRPNVWEIPGGRLKSGENPLEGLKRETKEEIGLDVEVLNPLRIHYFTRDDGQKITMITFLCKPLSDAVLLSNEHSEHVWINIDDSLSKLDKPFHEEVRIFNDVFRSKRT